MYLVAIIALLLAGCSGECRTVVIPVPLAPQDSCQTQPECDAIGVQLSDDFVWSWQQIRYVDQWGREFKGCS